MKMKASFYLQNYKIGKCSTFELKKRLHYLKLLQTIRFISNEYVYNLHSFGADFMHGADKQFLNAENCIYKRSYFSSAIYDTNFMTRISFFSKQSV